MDLTNIKRTFSNFGYRKYFSILLAFSHTPASFSDTFVKVTALSPYGDEIGKHKTETIKDSNEPVFDDSFVFQVSWRYFDHF